MGFYGMDRKERWIFMPSLMLEELVPTAVFL